MRILVSGGAGYIGSHTVKELRHSGHEAVVFDNLSAGHRQALGGSELFVGDLADPGSIRRCLEHFRPEAVVHFAASIFVGESVSAPAKYYRNNAVGSLNLLEALVEGGVQGIVFSSTCAVYGEPRFLPLTEEHPLAPANPYGHSKRFVEQMLADFRTAYGLRSVCLRYFNAAGADPEGVLGEDHHPETHLIPLVLRGALGSEPLKVFGDDYETPDGTCTRDYIHVQDLARAHVRAVERLGEGWAGEPLNLGCGREYSVLEVIRAAERVTGRTIAYQVHPRRPGDVPRLVADNRRAEAALGWQPEWTDLEQIVRSTWEWMQAHPQGYGA
ncbi:MAG: UDP-glucose 4-epimerase GalE [Candidatus Latescibacteria bacterium]|nr:UDP-glucose 4-epimerase GalE [Candidatus Latescibacterota bacterium]